MFKSILTAHSIVAALALVPTARARADTGDFVAGAVVGGLLLYGLTQGGRSGGGGAQATPTYRPGIPSTEQGRMTQTALN